MNSRGSFSWLCAFSSSGTSVWRRYSRKLTLLAAYIVCFEFRIKCLLITESTRPPKFSSAYPNLNIFMIKIDRNSTSIYTPIFTLYRHKLETLAESLPVCINECFMRCVISLCFPNKVLHSNIVSRWPRTSFYHLNFSLPSYFQRVHTKGSHDNTIGA